MSASSPASSRRTRSPSLSRSVAAPSAKRADRLLFTLLAGLVALACLTLLLSFARLRCHTLDAAYNHRHHDRLRRQVELGNAQDSDDYDDGVISPDAKECSPAIVNANDIEYRMPHRFYNLLKSLSPPYPPPVLRRKHKHLCDPKGIERIRREWSYCLPITGRQDLPYCAAPDRMDLLIPQTPQTLCYSSVLHMLLVDVYAEFKHHGFQPALLFGSMLGAVRNQSLISFTEDADLGYRYSRQGNMKAVREALWKKGYHLFREGILRVCVAPNHPLASNLYDPRRDSLKVSCHVPYVDLYKMTLLDSRREWEVEEIRKHRKIPTAQFEPYSQVKINDLEFDTLADPIDFLVNEYGVEWQTPKKRGTYRVIEDGQQADLPEGAMPPILADVGDTDEFDDVLDFDMPEYSEDEAEAEEEGEIEELEEVD